MSVPSTFYEVFNPEEAGLKEDEFAALDPYLSDTEFTDETNTRGASYDMSNIVVVDGLPRAPESKYQKLMMFVTKVVTQLGAVAEDGIFMPLNKDTKMSEGFALIEYQTVASAENAVKSLNGFQLDAKHTLIANRYEDIQKHRDAPEKFEPPALQKYTRTDDLWSWLGDSRLRDQFALRYNNETEILWAETNSEPVPQYAGERVKEAGRNWTEDAVMWSPQGTYFFTFHPQGMLVWGGEKFKEIARLAHPGVHQAVVSPCERYIGTWSGFEGNASDDDAFIVWDLRSRAQLRSFKQVADQDNCEFVWSHDGNYLGRINNDRATGKELIQVYETPSMTLLGKRSIISPGARELQFSPAGENLLATWTPETNNQPASVTLFRIPSKEVVRSKQLFNVENIRIHWHPQGKYLAVQATLLSKAQAKKKKKQQEAGYEGDLISAEKKGPVVTTFEFFRVTERMCPVEAIKINDVVHDFVWEPHGSRFSITHGDGPLRFNISFYEMEPKDSSDKARVIPGAAGANAATRVELIRTLTDRQVNHMSWSPRGGMIVLAGLDNLGGELEFYEVDTNTKLGRGDHMQCNRVAWDPSGRLIATVKAQPMVGEVKTRQTVENGYVIWNFLGKRVFEDGKEAMFQFLWRPRPALLEPAESKKVQKNLKKYIQKYQDEDRFREARRDLLRRVRYRRLRDEYHALVKERHNEWLQDRPERVARGIEAEDPEAEFEIQRYTYDQIISRTVEKM